MARKQTPRVTIRKSGKIWVISKGGREIGYAQTKMNARKRAEEIREKRRR